MPDGADRRERRGRGGPQTLSTLVSSESFNRSAADAYRKVLQDAATKGQLNRDAAQVERVRRIAAATPTPRRGGEPGIRWTRLRASEPAIAWRAGGGGVDRGCESTRQR
jgi:hypothetical protein